MLATTSKGETVNRCILTCSNSRVLGQWEMWESFNVHTNVNSIGCKTKFAFKITDIALRKALDNSEFLISKETLKFVFVLLGAKVLMSFFVKFKLLCAQGIKNGNRINRYQYSFI